MAALCRIRRERHRLTASPRLRHVSKVRPFAFATHRGPSRTDLAADVVDRLMRKRGIGRSLNKYLTPPASTLTVLIQLLPTPHTTQHPQHTHHGFPQRIDLRLHQLWFKGPTATAAAVRLWPIPTPTTTAGLLTVSSPTALPATTTSLATMVC